MEKIIVQVIISHECNGLHRCHSIHHDLGHLVLLSSKTSFEMATLHHKQVQVTRVCFMIRKQNKFSMQREVIGTSGTSIPVSLDYLKMHFLPMYFSGKRELAPSGSHVRSNNINNNLTNSDPLVVTSAIMLALPGYHVSTSWLSC